MKIYFAKLMNGDNFILTVEELKKLSASKTNLVYIPSCDEFINFTSIVRIADIKKIIKEQQGDKIGWSAEGNKLILNKNGSYKRADGKNPTSKEMKGGEVLTTAEHLKKQIPEIKTLQ